MANRKGSGRGGRPPKPRNIHLVDGTFRPDRHGDRDAAKQDTAENKSAPLLTPPRFLGRDARTFWRRAAKLLRDRGTVSQLDRDVLAMLCEALGEVAQSNRGVEFDLAEARAVLEIQEPTGAKRTDAALADWRRARYEARRIIGHSALQMPGKDVGTWVRNPAVVNRANAEKRVRDFAGEFGMTPSSLVRLRGGGIVRPPADAGDYPEGAGDAAADSAGA